MMDGHGATLRDAKAAKQKLRRLLSNVDEVRGIGIMPLDDGYAIKVNFSAAPHDLDVPQTVDGVPVVIDVIGSIEAL